MPTARRALDKASALRAPGPQITGRPVPSTSQASPMAQTLPWRIRRGRQPWQARCGAGRKGRGDPRRLNTGDAAVDAEVQRVGNSPVLLLLGAA
jgi:hypothetical protein